MEVGRPKAQDLPMRDWREKEKNRQKALQQPEVVAHAFVLSTQEAEAGESLWTWGQLGLEDKVQANPGLHSGTLPQNKINKRKKTAEVIRQLWTLATLPQDLSLIPSMHTVAHGRL